MESLGSITKYLEKYIVDAFGIDYEKAKTELTIEDIENYFAELNKTNECETMTNENKTKKKDKIKELERRKNHNKNYLEIKSIDREINRLRRRCR